MRQTVDVIAAEARAVEFGHHAFRRKDGSYEVRSESRPDLTWLVRLRTVHQVLDDRGPVWVSRVFIQFDCTCESGTFRGAELVPCWHAALVGRRLEREGLARWRDGLWTADGDLFRQHRDVDDTAKKVRVAFGDAAIDIWEA